MSTRKDMGNQPHRSPEGKKHELGNFVVCPLNVSNVCIVFADGEIYVSELYSVVG